MIGLLDRNEFRAWLEASGNRIVGRTVTETCCPIATFLRRQKGMKRPWVGIKDFTIDDLTGPLKRLPAWATRFICEIDSYGGLAPVKVRAKEALRVLDSIKAK